MTKFLTAKSHKVTSNFTYIDWQTLTDRIKHPIDIGSFTPEQAKDKSEVIAATDAPNKQKETVLLHDNFTLLRLDLDDTQLDIESISDTLANMGFTSFIIHTTASHQQGDNGNRYRVYIQLAAALCFNDWATLESYLSYIFMADDCATRPQQIMYLPVRFKGDNYQHKIVYGDAFNTQGSKLLSDAKTFIAEQKQQQETASKSAIIKPCFKENLVGNQVSIIDAINTYYEWDSLLLQYGYKRQGKAFLPPESSSNKAGVYILTSNTDGRERYYSHHESDPCAIGKCIDQFDFIAIRSYGGNTSQAIKDIAATHFSAIDKHNKKEYAINQQNLKAQSAFFQGVLS
ncbi:hypothetical protein [Thalassotalea sp. PP2-459]|uniref:hypothetical protein n=1 Tax=Thalassotalea sp. PP2-459 TaxID=1742724 RepID=UPI00094209F8|nr:hypothetical protein [Thalassotalea sp. PP2-459]OKY27656.1 hypothetical protein BI291_07880 [Thalassotalea sp. PP2-459]